MTTPNTVGPNTRRSPRRKRYCPAFWETLVRLGIQPVEIAPVLHWYWEWEIVDEMEAARRRVDEAQREQRLQARLFSQDRDVPVHLRERRATHIPQARPGIK